MHTKRIIYWPPSWNKVYTLLCILKLFTDIIHELSLKKCVVTPNFLFGFQ